MLKEAFSSAPLTERVSLTVQLLLSVSPHTHSPIFSASCFINVNINLFSTEIKIVFWFYL